MRRLGQPRGGLRHLRGRQMLGEEQKQLRAAAQRLGDDPVVAGVDRCPTGIAGACWNCKIMTLKVLDANNYGLYSWWADAMIWAADNGSPGSLTVSHSGGPNQG